MPKETSLRRHSIQLPCGQAKPGKEVAFMAKNMGDFSRKFNERTKSKTPGQVVNVKIKIFPDGTYQFIVKTSPTIKLIKAKVNSQNVLSSQSLKEIAEIKLPDLNTEDLAKAQKIIAGTARSAGVKIEG